MDMTKSQESLNPTDIDLLTGIEVLPCNLADLLSCYLLLWA